MQDYFVAFWNVENLFDEESSPHRTDKLWRTLRNELKGWTPQLVARKIHQLASIVGQMNGGKGPDLLGVCEVENEYVLDLLAQALASTGRTYGVAHADTQDQRGIDVAFLYDPSLFAVEVSFSHYIVKRSATRDLFQVNFLTNAQRRLVVVGNHWPARSAGRYESEPYRIIAGETLAYFHERIREVLGSNDVGVLAMGDFNDQPFDRSLVDYALSESTRTKVTRARTPRLLNLMWPALGDGVGTYYHNNVPNVLDQFLVSKGLLTGKSGFKVRPESIEVLRLPEMVSGGSYPTPIRFGLGSKANVNGYSDHFPISVVLREP